MLWDYGAVQGLHSVDWLILSGTKCRRNWSEIYNLSSIKAASHIKNKSIISSLLVSDFIPDYILNMLTICLRVISGLHFDFIHNFPLEYILDIFGRNLKFVPDFYLKYDHNFSFKNIEKIFKIRFQYKPRGNFDCNLPHMVSMCNTASFQLINNILAALWQVQIASIT